MNGLGTIVNVLAIIIAGGIGVSFRGKLKVPYQRLILQAVGAVVLLLGVKGLIEAWFVIDGTQTEITGTLLVLFALLVGGVFGEAFRLDRLLDKLGEGLRRRFEKDGSEDSHTSGAKATDGKTVDGKTVGGKSAGTKKGTPPMSNKAAKKEAVRMAKAAAAGKAPTPAKTDVPVAESSKGTHARLSELPTYDLPDLRTGHLFGDGFAIASVICAMGTLSVTGAIEDGLYAETEILFAKAIIDALIIFALSTVYGAGPSFAALPMLIVQGIFTLVAVLWYDLLTPTLIDQLTVIASVISIGMGVNLCFGKRWRVINLLPSFLISPIYGLAILAVEKAVEK